MNKKIKILHVFGELNLGGAETVIMNFYQHIDLNKFQFDFVVHGNDDGVYSKIVKNLGGNIYHVPKYKGYNHFIYKKCWKNFFEEHNDYNIIHAHMRSTASIYLKIAKKYGLKTIAHSHSVSNGVSFKSLIKDLLQYRIRHIADYFMGCSYEANVWLFGKKVADSEKCIILNNAIDYDKFKFNINNRKKIKKLHNLKNNDIILGYVARFIESKNHIYLIDVLEQLLKKNNNYKLMFCGSGEYKEQVIEYVRKKGLNDSVIFVDSTMEINEYYSAFDIFLFPSKFEGLGMVAVEAQVSGLPVISSIKIPKSIKISSNVKFLDINDYNIEEWVETILLYTSIIQNTTRDDIAVSKQYSVQDEVRLLEKKYLEISQNK